MDLLENYRVFAQYNRWMNEKLYGICSKLADAERKRDRKAFFGSIHKTLNHLLLADRSWLSRLTGDSKRFASIGEDGKAIDVHGLDQELYSDFGRLREEREKTDSDIEAYVARLKSSDLEKPLRYKTTTGKSCEHPLWWALSHFFNHQTHHRGQVTTLLSQLGHDPGVTDLVAMLRGPM